MFILITIYMSFVFRSLWALVPALVMRLLLAFTLFAYVAASLSLTNNQQDVGLMRAFFFVARVGFMVHFPIVACFLYLFAGDETWSVPPLYAAPASATVSAWI